MFINTYQILPYMDIRNVQKTGNMFYVYLPTSWCRKYNIKSNSKVTLLNNNDGSLGVFPHITEKKLSPLNIDLNEDDLFIINKLLVAAYINPTSSFKINLTKPVDIEKMLDQKKLLSIAMVEYDGKHLSCESSITIDDPISLLKTMIRKVKNLILLLKKSGDSNLLNIYEDEVDRSKLLIEKSIIHRLTFTELSSVKTVYLHYTALLSKDLERAVDQLLLIEKKETQFMDSVEDSINSLLLVLEKIAASNKAWIDTKDVILFAKKVDAIKTSNASNMSSYSKLIVKQMLTNISEVLFDWAVSSMIDEKQDKLSTESNNNTLYTKNHR